MFNPNFHIKYSHLKTALEVLKDFCVKKSTSVQFLLVRIQTTQDSVVFYATTPKKEQITLTVSATITHPITSSLAVSTQDLIRALSTGMKPVDEILFSYIEGGPALDYFVPRLAIAGAIHCEFWQADYDLFPNVKSVGEPLQILFQEGTLSKALDSLPDKSGISPNLDRVIFDVLNGRVTAISTDGKALTAVSAETCSMVDGKEIEVVADIMRYRPTFSNKIIKTICTLRKKDTIQFNITPAQDNGMDLWIACCTSTSNLSVRFEVERRSGFDTCSVWPRKDTQKIRLCGAVSSFLEPLAYVCTQIPRGRGVWLDIPASGDCHYLMHHVDNGGTYKVHVRCPSLEQERSIESAEFAFAFDPHLLQKFLKGLPSVDTVTLDLPVHPFGPMLCNCKAQNVQALIMPMRTGSCDKTYNEEVKGA